MSCTFSKIYYKCLAWSDRSIKFSISIGSVILEFWIYTRPLYCPHRINNLRRVDINLLDTSSAIFPYLTYSVSDKAYIIPYLATSGGSN